MNANGGAEMVVSVRSAFEAGVRYYNMNGEVLVTLQDILACLQVEGEVRVNEADEAIFLKAISDSGERS